MKKIIVILTILCSLITFAQKQKGTLHFKDGTTLKGLAKITGYGDRIKFRKEKKAKKEFYDSFDLKGVTIDYTKYEYKTVSGNLTGKIRLLEVVESGKVTLYRDIQQGHTVGAPGPNGMMTMGHYYSISHYYVSKDNEDVVSHLGSRGTLFSKNFKKAASEYFKDCNKLVEKIQNKEYKKKDIVDVVKYYNRSCK